MVNETKKPDTKKSDTFIKQSQKLLDESIDNLDSDVKDKLYMARRKALAQRSNNYQGNTLSKQFIKLLPITSVALTASIVLGILIQTGLWQSEAINIGNDLELVSTMDSIELYEDLDFYQWLAEDELQAG